MCGNYFSTENKKPLARMHITYNGARGSRFHPVQYDRRTLWLPYNGGKTEILISDSLAGGLRLRPAAHPSNQ